MSFDYILDHFGKNREKKTRFTDVELKAKELLNVFVNGSISSREFALGFDKVRVDFHKLMDDNGEIVIDEDTPLWLNSLLGLHYMDWYQFQQLKWHFEEHPDELTGETKERYAKIQAMGYDRRFMNTCKNVLKELDEKKKKL